MGGKQKIKPMTRVQSATGIETETQKPLNPCCLILSPDETIPGETIPDETSLDETSPDETSPDGT